MDFDKTVKELLFSMCGYLASVQEEDGGFGCEACGFEHGRADNAVYSFVCMYSHTKERIWLDRTEKLLGFRTKLENEDGSVSNDFQSPWKGITVFSALWMYKTLDCFGEILPENLYSHIENCFVRSAEWVHGNIVRGFRANINYYCASAAVNAMYGKRYGNTEYIQQAEELLSYCMGLFTENGILCGEGQPHDHRTSGGCVPADIGYIAEESVPCLTDAAEILGDAETMKKLAAASTRLLEFMLPDGAWDNSFGSRNNKWTYYGSRTSSGCISAFLKLSEYSPVLREAAFRNLSLIGKCTVDGALYGGPEYKANGQRPCSHHTFSHSAVLAEASVLPHGDYGRPALPCDSSEDRVRFFREINTYKVYSGKWIATVTAGDYNTYTWKNGAAHASGGTLSMLYHRDYGPVIAGSVSEYIITEKNNMQIPAGVMRHSPLLPRVQYEIDGKIYSTALSFDCEMKQPHGKNTVIEVSVKPQNDEHECMPANASVKFTYEFGEELKISVDSENLPSDAVFILPVVSSSGAAIRGSWKSCGKIFFLTGGFSADEYVFYAAHAEISVR